MKCSDYLCEQLRLNQEDKELAALIALLHDIGRFEQWMRYQSFADYKTIDHALFSSQLLFDEGLIREFIDDSQYDRIIKNAIEQHNKYKIDEGFDERTLLFIHIIRDADKLDNFRVKEEEDLETTIYVSYDEVNKETISPKIYDQFYHQELSKLNLLKHGKSVADYYWHGVSHMLGLETHDVTLPNYKLQPGNVFTIEPGLYLEEEGIGIRIEDNVLVVEDGCINLSKDIIKEPDEIEAFMAAHAK